MNKVFVTPVGASLPQLLVQGARPLYRQSGSDVGLRRGNDVVKSFTKVLQTKTGVNQLGSCQTIKAELLETLGKYPLYTWLIYIVDILFILKHISQI